LAFRKRFIEKPYPVSSYRQSDGHCCSAQTQAPRSESRPCNTPSNSTPNRAGKGYLRPSRRRGSGIVCKHARRLSGCAPIRLLQEITNRTSWWAIIANG
jgi:hypothetical protein